MPSLIQGFQESSSSFRKDFFFVRLGNEQTRKLHAGIPQQFWPLKWDHDSPRLTPPFSDPASICS
jgi:hypothetical protein